MYIKKTIGVLLGVLVTASLLLAYISGTSAQEEISGTGFRVSPTRHDLTIEPGETEVATIEVTNITNATQRAIPIINDFIPSNDESGSPQIIIDDSANESNNPNSIKPLLAGVLDDFVLEAEASEKVLVTFTVPEDYPAGAYYGVVRFIAETGQGTSEEGNVSLAASVGTIILITVPGSTVEKLSLVEIAAGNLGEGGLSKSGRFFSSSPDVISIRLQNDGNTFIAPFGTINITDWSGNIVQSIELNNETPRGNILPNTIRKFDNALDNVGSFGRYSVTAHIAYGDGGSSIITAETTFWVIPWFTLLLILVAVILVVFAATRGIKKYNQMIIDRQRGRRRR